jgi:hypothetical protein
MEESPRSFTVRNALFFKIAEVLNAAPGKHEKHELFELVDELGCIPEDGPNTEWVQQQFSAAEIQLIRDVQASLDEIPGPFGVVPGSFEEVRKVLYTFASEFVRLAIQTKLNDSDPA